jgi:SpoIID/LytB domain protein
VVQCCFLPLAHAESFQQKLGVWFAEGETASIEEALAERLERGGDPEAHLELASLRKDLGDLPGAAQAYGNYLALRPDREARSLLARLWVRLGELGNAWPLLRDLEKEDPRDPEVLWTLAEYHLRRAAGPGLPEDRGALLSAREKLQLLVGTRPDLALGHWRLAEVCRRLGDDDRALESYTRALKKDGSFKGAHWRMARLYAAKGALRNALRKYEQAMGVEPDNEVLRKEAKLVALRAPGEASEARQERRKKWEEWKAPEETPVEPSPVTLRVGLATGLGHLLFRCDDGLSVTTPSGNPVTVLPKGSEYHVEHLPAKGTQTEAWAVTDAAKKTILTFSNRLHFSPLDPVKTLALHAVSSNKGYFYAREEDRAYRGTLEISPRPGNGFQVISRVSLEAYLAGVLPAEMPPLWPLEAQKAQAVVARTYALSKMGRHNSEGFDVCDSVHCQVYRGVRAESPRPNEAVNATAGWVLKKGGKLVPVVFSAQCGGHTQDYEEAWGYEAPVVGVADQAPEDRKGWEFPLSPRGLERWVRGDPPAYCRTPELPGYQNHRWTWLVEAKDLEKRAGTIGRLKRLKVTRRTTAGFVQRLVAEGTAGQREIKGDAIRRFLGGVRSNLLWIEPQFDANGWPEEFIVYGGGWGHGIGMCQVGCLGLAKAGKDYKAIMRHYFPKAGLEKLDGHGN